MSELDTRDVMNIREDIGYLKHSVESLREDHTKLFKTLTEKDERDREQMEKMNSLLDEMSEQFRSYKTVAKVLRAIGGILLLTLTLKMGDIPTLIRSIF